MSIETTHGVVELQKVPLDSTDWKGIEDVNKDKIDSWVTKIHRRVTGFYQTTLDIKSIPEGIRQEASIAFLTETDPYTLFVFHPYSTSTPDGITVLTPTSGGGRWIRYSQITGETSVALEGIGASATNKIATVDKVFNSMSGQATATEADLRSIEAEDIVYYQKRYLVSEGTDYIFDPLSLREEDPSTAEVIVPSYIVNPSLTPGRWIKFIDNSVSLKKINYVTAMPNIKSIFLYTVTTDPDFGLWIGKTSTTSWYKEYESLGEAATRGCMSKFPLRSAIACTSNTVTIFSLEDNPKVWMVFELGVGIIENAIGPAEGHSIVSVKMSHGIMWVLTSGNTPTLYAVDFVSDKVMKMNASGMFQSSSTIRGRNSQNVWRLASQNALPAGEIKSMDIFNGISNTLLKEIYQVVVRTDSEVCVVTPAFEKYSISTGNTGEAIRGAKFDSEGNLYVLNGTAGSLDVYAGVINGDRDSTTKVFNSSSAVPLKRPPTNADTDSSFHIIGKDQFIITLENGFQFGSNAGAAQYASVSTTHNTGWLQAGTHVATLLDSSDGSGINKNHGVTTDLIKRGGIQSEPLSVGSSSYCAVGFSSISYLYQEFNSKLEYQHDESFTISFWLNSYGGTAEEELVRRAHIVTGDWVGRSWGIYIDSTGRLAIQLYTDSDGTHNYEDSDLFLSTEQVRSGTWRMITVQIDRTASKVRWFMDESLQDEWDIVNATGSFVNPSATTMIGLNHRGQYAANFSKLAFLKIGKYLQTEEQVRSQFLSESRMFVPHTSAVLPESNIEEFYYDNVSKMYYVVTQSKVTEFNDLVVGSIKEKKSSVIFRTLVDLETRSTSTDLYLDTPDKNLRGELLNRPSYDEIGDLIDKKVQYQIQLFVGEMDDVKLSTAINHTDNEVSRIESTFIQLPVDRQPNQVLVFNDNLDPIARDNSLVGAASSVSPKFFGFKVIDGELRQYSSEEDNRASNYDTYDVSMSSVIYRIDPTTGHLFMEF